MTDQPPAQAMVTRLQNTLLAHHVCGHEIPPTLLTEAAEIIERLIEERDIASNRALHWMQLANNR